MGRNTFDVAQVLRNQEIYKPAKQPIIAGDYEITPTGQDGWMSFRYQYKVGIHDYFGYAETVEEAREAIINAQKAGN